MNLRKAAQAALAALQKSIMTTTDCRVLGECEVAAIYLRAALEQEQEIPKLKPRRLSDDEREQGEPVAWMDPNTGEVCRANWLVNNALERDVDRFTRALYTAPPQRKPLTDTEIDKVTIECFGPNADLEFHKHYARAIERAHGIGSADGR